MHPHRRLYQEYPKEIRSEYQEVVRARDWNRRHASLLDLAETALVYFASLALSDYRSRCDTPSPRVEGLLDRSRTGNLTLGHALGIFRASVEAVADPLFPRSDTSPDRSLLSVERFGAAMAELRSAVNGLQREALPSVINVPIHVERADSRSATAGSWWHGWERIVEYRNKVAHASRSRWPVNSEHYFDTLGPLLRDALTDLLTYQPVLDSLLRHPVVTITLITERPPEVVHAICGEKSGVWFEDEVVAPRPVMDRWSDDHWKATSASSYIVELDQNDQPSFRALYWSLRDSPPPALTIPELRGSPTGENARGKRTGTDRPPRAKHGRGTAPGTCGEFAQGMLSDGTVFHVTCPINKSSTVVASLRPAATFSVTGLLDYHRKLGLAIEYAAEELDLGAVDVTIRHWTDLDVGKGMGSSTADVLAAVRAIANAVGETLDAETEGALAARVESSDGTMYDGIAAVNHRTCVKVRSWEWFPEFAIVMLVPHDSVDTDSIGFSGQERLTVEYEDLLLRMDQAIEMRDIAAFATQSTRSAALNSRFLLNPYSRALTPRLDEFDALGVNVGHTGTVCGLLFPNSETGRVAASEACFEVRREFPDLKDVKVVTTPHCPVAAEVRAGEPG